MTIQELLKEIDQHFNYWVGTYDRKELTVNDPRIICEAVSRCVILKIKGPLAGGDIIYGRDITIPVTRDSVSTGPLGFSELLDAINDIGGFNGFAKARKHFELVKAISDPGSHSKLSKKQLISVEDLESCNNSLRYLIKWLYGNILKLTLPISISNTFEGLVDEEQLSFPEDEWKEFMLACENFDTKKNQYILVVPEFISDNTFVLENILKVNWRLVIDFNNKSDEEKNGLLYNFNQLIGPGYKKSFVLNDRIDFDPGFKHYWFFANGQGSVLPINDFISWRRVYKRFLSDKLYSAFQRGSRLRQRIVVFLNISPNYTEAIIDELNAVDDQNLKHVICSRDLDSYENVFSIANNVTKVHLKAEEIAEAISLSLSFDDFDHAQKTYQIPSVINEKKDFISVSQDHYDYLRSLGIEIVYKGIEKDTLPDDNNEFYKGSTISWRDLADEKDKTRYSYDNIHTRLVAKLKENRLDEVELIHEPGAGGTTLSRRLAYDLSLEYPTVTLQSYSHKKTIEALRIIYDQYTKGSLPLLIILEAHLVNNQPVYRELSAAKKNAVIVIVHRGTLNSKNKKYFVQAQLQGKEIGAFESTFATLVPKNKQKIRSIVTDYQTTPQYVTPVLYALTAYGEEYNGLEEYVSKSLTNITFEQKKLVGFICLIYYYTQKSVPIELFTSLLGTTRSNLDLAQMIGYDNPIFELLHQEDDNEQYNGNWRPRYFILGEEAMKIILNGGVENKDNWKVYLANWLKDLVVQVRASIEWLNDEALLILNSLFIERANLEELHYKEFTKAINDLTNRLDGMELFEELTKSYPNEAHFHGHYARYAYSSNIGIKDFPKAIDEANKALDIQPDNSAILHTLGMCYREQAEAVIYSFDQDSNEVEEVEDEVQKLTETACDWFDQSIEKDSQNLYGYESQIRTILNALNFGFKIHGNASKETFITNPVNVWYAEKLDKVTYLLEEALFTIEQLTKLDNKERIIRSADFIHDCEGLFYKTLGQHIAAKNKFEDLIKNTPSGYAYMRPHYIRMFITCLLASKVGKNENLYQGWERISEAELQQCIGYLDQCIFEEPGKTQNIKLWLQAVRFLKNPMALSTCINKVETWAQSIKQDYNSQLEGFYYSYVLHAVQAISEGGNFDLRNVTVVKDTLDKMKPFVQNDKFCFEWYGRGEGVQKMVNHKKLGETSLDFFERNRDILMEVSGRIKDASRSQKGLIILDCGLDAFFVPNIGGFTDRNKNDKIKCYIGFRYDQIQAWSVVLDNNVRDDNRRKRDVIELNPLVEEPIIVEEEKVKPESKMEHIDLPKLEGPKVLGKIDISQFDRKRKRK